MKKVLFWLGLSLILTCLVAIGVCFVVFPNQTKEVYDKFLVFIQQPLPIAGVSITMIVGGALMIISRTSFGRKMLAETTAKFVEIETKYNEKVEQLKTIENEHKEEIEELTKQINYYKELLVELMKTIPNKKVNAIAEKVNAYETKETING